MQGNGNTPHEEFQRLFNADEAGALNGVSGRQVRRLGKRGKIKVYRLGTTVRFNPTELRELMERQGEVLPVIPRPRVKK